MASNLGWQSWGWAEQSFLRVGGGGCKRKFLWTRRKPSFPLHCWFSQEISQPEFLGFFFFLSFHPSMAVIFSLFPNVHFPLYFLKRGSRFFSLNFFSSCWWIVLKIVNPQGIPKAQGGVLLCCPWEVGGSHRGEWGGHIIVWLVCLTHILFILPIHSCGVKL